MKKNRGHFNNRRKTSGFYFRNNFAANKAYFAFYSKIKSRYSVAQIQSNVAMLHKNTQSAGTRDSFGINVNVFRNMPLGIHFGKKTSSASFKNFLSNKNERQLLNFLIDEESLHTLINALWRVYHSNNLRLSHSFFRLINLITERGFKLKELLPPYGFTNNVTRVRNFLTRYETRIRTFLPISRTYMGKSYFSGTAAPSLLQDNIFRVSRHSNYFNKSVQSDNLFFSGGEIVPVLERIYEGIESNYLFYNASSYQSVKTLYRLTNSLWKIYSGHNLELSRNFTSLINTVTEKNKINRIYNQADTFSTTSSLQHLVNALKRAFSGGNLHLRHSLINLFHDIRTAGDKVKTTSTYKKTFVSRTVKNKEINKRYREKQKDTVVLLYRLFQAESAANYGNLTHALTTAGQTSNTEIKQLQQYIDQKLKTAETSSGGMPDIESVVKTVMKRLKEERAEQWRFEKLQRGLI